MTAPTVQIDGLTKSYGAFRALSGVSFSTGTGVIGLLGPNGAGKTTLLRIAATVIAPEAGRLRLLGFDPARPDDRLALRRRLGYLPQEPGFYGHFSAFDFVDYVAILKEMTDRRPRHDEVRRVLAAAGLEDQSGKKIKKLSGGMRRRLGLAQALLGKPDLLILDEPTAGLDPEQRLRFRELVSGIGEHRTVLLSTHQTEDVATLCHRVVVLTGGEVRFDGSVPALADLARGRVWISGGREPGARLAWRTGDGHTRNIGEPPAGADLAEPTIEDAYLLLAGEQPAEMAA